jgi:serine protease inhibitor
MVALALSAACSAGTDPGGGGKQPTGITTLPRTLTGGEARIVGAANDFSWSLFHQLNTAQSGVNVFTSPLSASMALGMTMNGAAGSTYDQMRSALALGTVTDADINAGYGSLITLLRGLDPSVDFRIANSIWYLAGYPVNQSFVDVSKSAFDAQVTGLAFDNAALDKINAWVSSATNARIPTIIDMFDPQQVMLLVNAIYFKGSWRDRFDPALTANASFHGVGGDAPMKLMHRNASMSYYDGATFDAVDLPYGNSAFTMTVVLPRAGTSVETVAASLQSGSWSSLTSGLHTNFVDLYLPRFTLTWERKLNPDLQALGMRDAFGAADFTRMSPRGKELSISTVLQKTYVDVNEEGTEAAAVTGVGVVAVSAPIPVEVRVDRPFIFVIRERLSGTVIFMGKIVKMP